MKYAPEVRFIRMLKLREMDTAQKRTMADGKKRKRDSPVIFNGFIFSEKKKINPSVAIKKMKRSKYANSGTMNLPLMFGPVWLKKRKRELKKRANEERNIILPSFKKTILLSFLAIFMAIAFS